AAGAGVSDRSPSARGDPGRAAAGAAARDPAAAGPGAGDARAHTHSCAGGHAMSPAPGPPTDPENTASVPLGGGPVTMEDLRSIPILAESVKKKGDKWFDNKIVPYVVRRRFGPDEKIVREGEYRDSAYYLVSGSVEVLVERLPGDAKESDSAADAEQSI